MMVEDNFENHLNNFQCLRKYYEDTIDDELIALTSNNINLLRSLKHDFEHKVVARIHELDATNDLDETNTNKIKLKFFKDFIIDRIGELLKTGETGICEGWHIPKYEFEYSNSLALPHTEDKPPGDTMRLRKPNQECFNCLATSHKIQDCPIKQDQERINMYRKTFATQSMAAKEQNELFSNRYTNDQNDGVYRGFKPGKISDELRQALGLNKNQLPPFIYVMRELGYPVGWLIEAQVKSSGLSVLNGQQKAENLENGEIEEDVKEIEVKEEKSVTPEYDPDRIINFEGFNTPVPEGYVDEADMYGVKRYSESISKSEFMKKLKLRVVKYNTRKIKHTISSKSLIDLTKD